MENKKNNSGPSCRERQTEETSSLQGTTQTTQEKNPPTTRKRLEDVANAATFAHPGDELYD
jgi:hypothetical protein